MLAPNCKAISKRELARRLRLAQDELAASLFFMTPPMAKKRKRYTIGQLRFSIDSYIRHTVRLFECLENGGFMEDTCGACGRPFGDGAEVVRTEDGPAFHATEKCCGSKPPRRAIYKLETRTQRLAWRKHYIERAKAYLETRGI